jgi:hypothetical protein
MQTWGSSFSLRGWGEQECLESWRPCLQGGVLPQTQGCMPGCVAGLQGPQQRRGVRAEVQNRRRPGETGTLPWLPGFPQAWGFVVTRSRGSSGAIRLC